MTATATLPALIVHGLVGPLADEGSPGTRRRDGSWHQTSSDIHEPREFPEYAPPYYATFWLDPFGFMLEAVCHYDRP